MIPSAFMLPALPEESTDGGHLAGELWPFGTVMLPTDPGVPELPEACVNVKVPSARAET